MARPTTVGPGDGNSTAAATADLRAASIYSSLSTQHRGQDYCMQFTDTSLFGVTPHESSNARSTLQSTAQSPAGLGKPGGASASAAHWDRRTGGSTQFLAVRGVPGSGSALLAIAPGAPARHVAPDLAFFVPLPPTHTFRAPLFAAQFKHSLARYIR